MIQLKKIIPLTILFLTSLTYYSQGYTQSESTVPLKPNSPVDPIIYNAPPPPTGRPGRRADAGSRGCETDEASNLYEPQSLLALVPTQETATSTVVFGKTAADHPTFWFYVPYHAAFTATFVLQDQDGNPIYQTDVAMPQTAGILSLTLPETVAPLETGKLYQWFFKLYCRSISPPDAFVHGWIQREALSSDLTQQLQTATVQQQVRLYAASGFWFEALTAAAELHQTNEDAAWVELLNAIGLENVTDEVIINKRSQRGSITRSEHD